MNIGNVGWTILGILSPVLLAALTWLAAKGAQYIKAKIDNEKLEGVLLRLNDAVVTAVKELEQTVVKAIELARADGVLTDEEKKTIKSQAVSNIKSHLGRKGLLELAKVLGLEGWELDRVVASKVEAAVHDLG